MNIKSFLLAGAVLALGFTPFNSSSAADNPAAAKKILADHQDSVVWVSAVCKISFTAESTSDKAMNIPDQEKKFEALGTVITSDGLIVAALSPLDPSREISGREVSVRGERVKLDASVTIKEMRVIMPDGTEVPADIVMKDVDLDLAFIRVKADSKEAKSVTFKPVDIKNNAKVEMSDDVVSLSRTDEVLNRQPSVMRGQVISLIQKPREFIRASTTSLGAPTFTTDGKLVGIGVNRSMRNSGSAAVLIPASDITELADQAKSAKADKPATEK